MWNEMLWSLKCTHLEHKSKSVTGILNSTKFSRKHTVEIQWNANGQILQLDRKFCSSRRKLWTLVYDGELKLCGVQDSFVTKSAAPWNISRTVWPPNFTQTSTSTYSTPTPDMISLLPVGSYRQNIVPRLRVEFLENGLTKNNEILHNYLGQS